MRVGIIGAGASGMVAAITAAANTKNEVLIFERQSRVGRKLLATGNGRCNLSNHRASSQYYHGAEPEFVTPALKAFPVDKTLDFFHSLGLCTTSEYGGRIYPYSDQANSVVDVLRFALSRRNITLFSGCEITGVKKTADGFALKSSDQSFTVDRLIVSCGGAAGGKLGGSLSGYQLLRSLGHHCTKLYPSLVQLKTETSLVKSLKGVRANAELSLTRGGSLLAKAGGEVQFTEYGISGPAVFDLSRTAATVEGTELHLNLLPVMSEDALLSNLCIRISQRPNLLCEDLLTGILHNRLGRMLLKACGIPLNQPLSALNWAQLTDAVKITHDFCLTVTGTMGMDHAQVTAGGICTAEFDPKTLQSRLVPGLYATGEVLDVDGDCGGFNLQWAWSSGRLAGQLRETEETA